MSGDEPNAPGPGRASPTYRLVVFFGLAFVATWSLYLVGARIDGPLGEVLVVASGFGPTAAAVSLVATADGRAGLRRWLGQLTRWRLGWGWFLGPLLIPPMVLASGVLAHLATGGRLGPSENDPSLWWTIPLIFLVVLVVGGPVGEEFGWRGYAQPGLQRVMGPTWASLLVGLLWGLWHLPRMLDPGAVQSLVPWWLFLGQVLVSSVFHAWLFNRTRSVVPNLILHASLNTSVGLLPVIPATAGSATPAVISLAIAVIAAAALVVLTRGRLGTTPQRSRGVTPLRVSKRTGWTRGRPGA